MTVSWTCKVRISRLMKKLRRDSEDTLKRILLPRQHTLRHSHEGAEEQCCGHMNPTIRTSMNNTLFRNPFCLQTHSHLCTTARNLSTTIDHAFIQTTCIIRRPRGSEKATKCSSGPLTSIPHNQMAHYLQIVESKKSMARCPQDIEASQRLLDGPPPCQEAQ